MWLRSLQVEGLWPAEGEAVGGRHGGAEVEDTGGVRAGSYRELHVYARGYIHVHSVKNCKRL